MEGQKKLLNAFLEKPTTYSIDVRDNSMLPTSLIDEDKINITIKPPSMYVLSLCADVLSEIPKEVYESKEMKLDEALKYADNIAKVLCILSSETNDYPKWKEAFILKNVSLLDLLKVMQETALKCNPAFFLNSFQIAVAQNPMLKAGIIHTSS